MKLAKLDLHQSSNVAAFIAHLQADKTHQIAYFGSDAAEIAAAIRAFDPPNNILLAYEGDMLVGLIGIDTDADSQRAWLYGPLLDHADWQSAADALYDAARRQGVIPAFVRDEEMFVDAANTNIADFAARHGFVPGVPTASLRLKREGLSVLPAPDVAELATPYLQAFISLHDSLFPNTYFSGQKLLDRLGARDKAFVAIQNGVMTGYVYGKIDPEATDGYIDFLGVAPDFRRRGVARQLISTVTNWLFSFPEIEAVTLTVEAANTAALALYSSIGFTHLQTLQSYRKRY